MIEELNAGEVVGDIVDIYPEKAENKRIKFEADKINNLLGTDLSKEAMLEIFKK